LRFRRSSQLLSVALVLLAASASAQDAPEELPEGPGREEAFYSCTACHGFAIVVQQGMSRQRWDETLTYMTERHGMPALEGADREMVLNYLSGHWPAKQRRGAANPFLR
jgi:hypothetical protein